VREYVEHFCGLECYQRFSGKQRDRRVPNWQTLAVRRRQIEAYPNLMSDVEHKQRQSRVLIYIH
jgi:hypothetical protein